MLFFDRCNRRRLWALSLLCCALPAHAQQRLTAGEAVALALSQPHVRQELAAEVRIAHSDVLAARTWSNPEVQLAQERGDDGPMGPARETSVLLSQTFELGGRRGLRRDAAEQGVVAAELGAEYERVRLRGEVLRAYSAAVAAERRMRAQADIAGGLRDLAAVAGKRHGAGDLSGYESRRIAQASAQAEARRAQAEAEQGATRARLAGLVGDAALTAELDTDPPLPAIPQPTGELRTAELDVLQARREHAEARARAERRLALPVTVGVGSKRLEEAGVRDEIALFELSVPLPLFDRNQAGRTRTAAEVDRAEAQYRRALRQARSRRAAVEGEARHLSASARHLLGTAVPEAARLTEIAQSSFAEGELDLVGLLDAYDAQNGILDQALEQHARALDALIELQLLSPLSPTAPPSR